jgi:hypothetical protein
MSPRCKPFRRPKRRHGTGQVLTARGYIRLTAGRHRGQYQHRARITLLWAESPHLCALWGWDGLPAWLTVHHFDGRRAHNCLENLQVLDKRIHDVLSSWKSDAVRRADGSII